MDTRIRLLLPLAAATLLASCASTDDRRVAAAQFAPGSATHAVNDAEYIAVVETLAARRGVKVMWVNPPKDHPGED